MSGDANTHRRARFESIGIARLPEWENPRRYRMLPGNRSADGGKFETCHPNISITNTFTTSGSRRMMSKMINIVMIRGVSERRSSNSAKCRQLSTFRLQNAVSVRQNAVSVRRSSPYFRRFGSDGRSSVLTDTKTSRQKHWRRNLRAIFDQ